MYNGDNKNWYSLCGNHFGVCISGSGKNDLWLDQNLGTIGSLSSEIYNIRCIIEAILSESKLLSAEKSSIYCVYVWCL